VSLTTSLASLALALSLATPPEAEPPRWTAELRGGLLGLYASGAAGPGGFPRGPGGELGIGRVLFENVELELAAGVFRAIVHRAATTVTEVPLTLSAKIFGPADLGFRPYLVGGVGYHLAWFDVTTAAPAATFHDAGQAWGGQIGIGATRALGPRFALGGDVRYQFLQVATPSRLHFAAGDEAAVLDGFRFALTATTRF